MNANETKDQGPRSEDRGPYNRLGAGGWINLIVAFLVTFKSIESARFIYSKLKKKKHTLWRNILNFGEPQVMQIS